MNVIANFMILVKFTSLNLLIIQVILNKVYDVIVFNLDFNSKSLSHLSNYIVDLAMRSKFGSTSMKEVVTTSISKEFDQNNHFFRGSLGSYPIIWDWH